MKFNIHTNTGTYILTHGKQVIKDEKSNNKRKKRNNKQQKHSITITTLNYDHIIRKVENNNKKKKTTDNRQPPTNIQTNKRMRQTHITQLTIATQLKKKKKINKRESA